jgi:hypothetical protein
VGGNSDIEQVEYFWALLSAQRAAVREKLDRQYAWLARSERGGHQSSVRQQLDDLQKSIETLAAYARNRGFSRDVFSPLNTFGPSI